MRYNSLKYCLLVALACLFTLNEGAAEPTIEAGKTIFQTQCGACHNRNMKDNLTGPALGGAEERWSAYPREDLYAWVRNSQSMIASGHPLAVELWNQWKPTVMTNFTSLSDEDIESVFLYISDQFNKVPASAAVADGGPGGSAGKAKTSPLLYWILFGVLAVVVAVLARVVHTLRYLVASEEGVQLPPQKTLWQSLTSKGVIGFLIFALVVLGGYTTVNNGISFGRQQGYAPTQPINFSHEIHAGIQGIDCQYCHDGARRSKHASIPPASTCMNCHRAVKKGTTHGTQEITKIFASIGYDPINDTYIDNYDKLSNEEIKEIYSKWIADNYLADNELASLDRKGERIVKEQWDNIEASLTHELKKSIAGPIEWVRIHMVPDHVYFNHSQHVEVGKVACQTCHGKVEQMPVLYQYAPLSMGWCVNCHRETEVQFTGNEYYKTYQQYHDAISKGEKSKVTVEDIGGLECQKCHY